MKKLLFSDLNTFMLRTPLFPIENYFKWINSNSSDTEFLRELFNDKNMDQFFESIKVTSPSLYDTLQNFLDGKKIRDEEYFLDSIFKYFIRSNTRCTPFGLFAGVNFGEFNNSETKLILNSTKLKKYVSVDMEWICGVVKQLEEKFYYKLEYRKNEGIYIKGNRAILIDVEKIDKDLIFQKSISLTDSLKLILNISDNYTPFDKILSQLHISFPNENISSLKKYLWNLIDSGYLVSNLKPSLNNEDVLWCLIKNLEKLNIQNKDLYIINNLIKKYQNELDSEKAIKIYDELAIKMKSLFNSNNYIQIDSKSNIKYANLNSNITSQLNDLMKILIILNDKNVSHDNKWKNYKTKFIEKYGETREVKLLDLLDEDLGLGIPQGYQEESIENKTQWLGRIGQGLKEFFFNKFEHSILKREEFIEIKDSDFENYELSNTDSIPTSLDINLSYLQDANGNDLFFVGSSVGALRAGNSFGRFSNIMENPTSLFDKINKKHSNSDVINCEIRFLPAQKRIANVSHCATASEFEICVSCGLGKSQKKKLPLDDIVIGIRNYKFYAKSLSQNKLITFTVNNMFNRHKFPAHLRFLWDVTIDHEIPWCLFYWDLFFHHYNYVPEIRYKNFILSPKKWVISKKEFNLNSKTTFKEFSKKLDNFITYYSVSRFVYFGKFDNKLLLDLQNLRCRRILYSYVIKNDRTPIWEYYQNCMHPVSCQNKSYCCELFIPLIKNEITYNKNNVSLYIPNSEENRIKLPFNEWISLKIYGANNRVDKFISNDIYYLIETLFINNIIDKFFFLRYRDPKDHIRLRLHGDSDTLLKGYSIIQYWMKNLMDKKISLNFVMDTYERELERYGGSDIIDYIETLFFSSSLTVIKLLKLRKKIQISDYQLGLICVTYFIKHFDLNLEDSLKLFNVSPSKFREQFKKERNNFIQIIEDIMYQKDNLSNEFKNVIKILSDMKEPISLVKNKLKDKNILPEKYNDILSSLIHMHLNRLFYNNLQIEPVVRAIARHAIYATYKKKINTQSLDCSHKGGPLLELKSG